VETTETRWQRHVDQGRRFVSQGNYAEAEQSLLAAVKEALTLGPADLRVASSLGILGKLKHRQGDRERAQGFLERALAVREEALGADHYGLVQGLNDLAALHYTYGNLAEARALYERALMIAERRLAPDHADVAQALYNLSRAYFKSNDHLRAEPLLTRLLEIKERTIGPDHADVAAILTALSRVRSMAGRHDEAEAMARRALDIRERALAPDDAAIAVSLELVAYFCAGRAKRTRSLADAERILRGGSRTATGEHGSSSDSSGAVGDALLEAELNALATEERSLRDRARAIRSRPGASREPNTLERSPASDVVAATESVAPVVPEAPVVEHHAAAQEAVVEAGPVEASEAAAAAPMEAESDEPLQVEHDGPAQVVEAAGAANADDGEPLVVLHNYYAADDVAWGFQSAAALHDASAAEPSSAPRSEPGSDPASESHPDAHVQSTPTAANDAHAESESSDASEPHAAADASSHEGDFPAPPAVTAYARWHAADANEAASDPEIHHDVVSGQDAAFPNAEYQDSPVTDAEYIPAVIVPRDEIADAPAMDDERSSLVDSLPAFLTGRRARWFLGITALAFMGAGAAGFAIGRGGRAETASSLAQVQQASRGSIDDSRSASPESDPSSSDLAAQSTAAGATHAAPGAARSSVPAIPDWTDDTPRPRRQPRIPSRSQARRLSRTMERMGNKVMTGMDTKLDSIGRSVELPPPTFGKP